MDFIATFVGTRLIKGVFAKGMRTILTPSQYKKIRKMNYEELQSYLLSLYVTAYEAGLREGEQEFNDAVIVNVDDAREVIGNEAISKLIGE